jgi:hypothetical protein
MTTESLNNIFTPIVLKKLFPEDRTDSFFDALFGDPAEGAFNISLEFKEHGHDRLKFELHLTQRPGKCLNCNLTYGLPSVFARHPIINISGLVQEINRLLGDRARCVDWQLGLTQEVSSDHHIIPLVISLAR